MKAFLSIKFHEDMRNRKKIESLSKALEEVGFETVCMARDHENWGKKSFSPEKLMEKTFKEIESSDLMVVDLTEKGVGLGIEAGYAQAHQIPVITVAETESDISDTLRGISDKVIHYKNPDQLIPEFRDSTLEFIL